MVTARLLRQVGLNAAAAMLSGDGDNATDAVLLGARWNERTAATKISGLKRSGSIRLRSGSSHLRSGSIHLRISAAILKDAVFKLS